jgi:hypothetical protein
MTTIAEVNRELLETAQRLTAEYRLVPPGSVLRCFRRAVREARRRGVALGGLRETAEALTRSMLEQRLAPARAA